jgi:hypothetical protein
MSLKKLEKLFVNLLWGLSFVVILGWVITHDNIRIRRNLSALASWVKR